MWMEESVRPNLIQVLDLILCKVEIKSCKHGKKLPDFWHKIKTKALNKILAMHIYGNHTDTIR